jgi:hypothetical protein
VFLSQNLEEVRNRGIDRGVDSSFPTELNEIGMKSRMGAIEGACRARVSNKHGGIS